MKKQSFFFAAILISIICYSQNYSLSSSQELKNRKGSIYMNLLGADENNIYTLKVTNKVRGVGINNAYDTYYSLCKYDNNLNPVFETELNKMIGDQLFQSLLFLQKRLYLFVWNFKKKSFILSAVELDKVTGNKLGDLKELYSYKKEDKWDDMEYTVKLNPDSSGFIISGQNTNNEKFDDAHYVTLVDKNLNITASVKMTPPIDHKMQMFAMENIIPEKNNDMLLFGRLIQATEIKKNQLKWEYKFHVIYRFDNKGNKLAEYAIDLKDKTIENCKIMQPPGTSDIYLSGFYSNKTESGKINGAFITKLENNSLKAGPIATKELNPVVNYTGYSQILFRDPLFDLGNKRIFLVAETYNEKIDRGRITDETKSYSMGNSSSVREFRQLNTYTYAYGDMLVVNLDLSSVSVKNLTVLNKQQTEKIAESPYSPYPAMEAPFPTGKPDQYNYYEGVAPFYSSTCVALINNKLMIMYNEQNKEVAAIEEKKETKHLGFDKSVLSCFTVDVNTGTVSKKEIATTTDQPIFMPRFGFVSGSNVFLPAMLLTRTLEAELKLAKISIR
jgi:hypothetical protein